MNHKCGECERLSKALDEERADRRWWQCAAFWPVWIGLFGLSAYVIFAAVVESLGARIVFDR